jgi:hypothetical protein
VTLPLDGAADLAATFRDAGLRVPPLPASLAGSLVRREEWVWATREMDPDAMYMFRDYLMEALDNPVDDYVAISHAGHGVNSYALSYHLVSGPLVLFAQTHWGGAYGDPGADDEEWAAQSARIEALLPLAEAYAESWDGTQRLLVLESTMREVASCRWFTPGDDYPWMKHDSSGRHRRRKTPSESVFEIAARELATGPKPKHRRSRSTPAPTE